jgi:ectoine hydroxylase-related dioxygenase (phytanoyl-CoA dioxygenase family)
MIDKNNFIQEFNEKGFVIVDNVLEHEFIKQTTIELEDALKKEVEYVGTTDYKFYGYVLSNAKYGGSFLEVFDNDNIVNPINWILGENSIIYSYTSSSMPPFKGNDASHIHVDCPIFLENYILRMGLILPLVDFTEDNGASYYLAGSHKEESMPDEHRFYKDATRLIMKAGQGCFFNTRVWHAGGVNKTDHWRHALTLNICRPWMKQYIDTPRLLVDTDLSNASEKVLQKLGFFSQPPTSYEEYYDISRKRLFS